MKAISLGLILVAGLAAMAEEEGYVSLFNGKDLTGWTGDTKGYLVENGNLVCKPGGNLYTEKEYADFTMNPAKQLAQNKYMFDGLAVLLYT